MSRLHPTSPIFAAVAAAAMLFATGCKNHSTATAANPFVAPSRVPPPGTRALLPGQAQPYYPGDPLPAMQSTAAGPGAAVASAEPPLPTADGHLAWGTPGGAAPAATPVSQSAANPTNVTPASFSAPIASDSQRSAPSEGSIAIPDDGGALRFAAPSASPSSAPQDLAPAGSPVAIDSRTTPIAGAAPGVQQAAYTEPVIPTTASEPNSMWRTPQVGQPDGAGSGLVPAAVATQPAFEQRPTLAATPSGSPSVAETMEVRLRAVSSPTHDGLPNIPRIRMPGHESGASVAGSADGFRPRTSMR